ETASAPLHIVCRAHESCLVTFVVVGLQVKLNLHLHTPGNLHPRRLLDVPGYRPEYDRSEHRCLRMFRWAFRARWRLVGLTGGHRRRLVIGLIGPASRTLSRRTLPHLLPDGPAQYEQQ